MKHRKDIKEKGKINLSRRFHEYKAGDRVALVLDISEPKGRFPKQFHGKTGVIEGKQGEAYIVKFLNGKAVKRIITLPAHLKPIKSSSKKENKK